MKTARLIFILTLCLLGSTTPLRAQYASVEGRIVDLETKEPLQGVNVFLASTTYGASTDSDGVYRIYPVQPGSYTLVFSMIGYESQRKSIQLLEGEELSGVDVTLEIQAYELEAVQVVGKEDRSWQRRFDKFQEQIIGTSSRAKQTTLLNWQAIDFEVDAAGRMNAYSNAPLIFENAALGYRITYALHEFMLDPQAGILRYGGEPFFENLNSSPEEEALWRDERKKAYLGSMAHLFSSILSDSTFEKGFQMYEGKGEEPVGSADLLVTVNNVQYQEIYFENPLKVVYARRKEREKGKFSLIRRGIEEEVSYLYLHAPSIKIEGDGYYAPPGALTATGALGERRLGDLVPRNFEELLLDDTFLALNEENGLDRSANENRELDELWPALYDHIIKKDKGQVEFLFEGLSQDYPIRSFLKFRLIDQQLSEGPNDTVLQWISSEYAPYFEAEALRRDGELAEAKQALLNLLQQPQDIPLQPILLSLARVYIENGERLKGQGAVWESISNIESFLEAELVLEDFKYVMTDDELEKYRGLDKLEEAKKFLEALWTKRHPYPGRQDNPRLVEHYARMLYAEEYYLNYSEREWFTDPDRTQSLQFPRAYSLNHKFNDKGLIYIRHGAPDDIIIALAGETDERRAAFKIEEIGHNERDTPDGDRLSFELREKWLPYEQSWEQSWEPNESWRYFNPAIDIHFILKGGGNNWRLASELPRNKEMFEAREEWGGIYAEMAINARQYESAKENPTKGAAFLMRPVFLESGELTQRFIEKATEETSLGLETDRHTWAENVVRMDLYPMPATFKGEDGKTDMVVYYAVATEQFREMLADSLILNMGFALHDTSWQEVQQLNQRISLPNSFTENALVSQMEVSVLPDSYYVAVYGFGLQTSLENGYTFSTQVPGYNSDQLQMSDIVLAQSIQVLDKANQNSRSSFEIIPNPTGVYRTSNPMSLYFEIYNLTFNENDATSYSLELELKTSKRRLLGGKTGGISIRTEQAGNSANAIEIPQIDISSVSKGSYELIVTVTDIQTGQSTQEIRNVELIE